MKFARYSWSAGSLLAGVIVAGLGIAGFLIPNHFIDGGFSGIAMLLAKLSGIPLPILIVVVNAPFGKYRFAASWSLPSYPNTPPT